VNPLHHPTARVLESAMMLAAPVAFRVLVTTAHGIPGEMRSRVMPKECECGHLMVSHRAQGCVACLDPDSEIKAGCPCKEFTENRNG